MDLSSIANPYDFSHPVSNPELFFGRTKERGEIGYYLEQAAKTQRPVSLAIIGDRAAGKTSLLNIIEAESTTKKLFPVRIDLDETDIRDEFRFFHKVLNALLIKAFDLEFFGGKSGRSYAVYLDMISAYVVPDTLEFAPWTFPIQFARARANNRTGVALDDASFKEDLRRVSSEIKRTVVLIFDECNVFKSDRYLLQKLRNIFMNLPGYMLVFSGTKDLFPIMDDIFSPIIRQFKKIEIGAFSRASETDNCVFVPLQKAGIPDKQVVKLLSATDIISDIHQLSGGRPYEIQLICHMLMRRCQMGQAKKFLLNVNVLEEIRSELATGQDIAERPIVAAARGLPKRALDALGVLCACEERIPFDRIWGIEWIMHGKSRWTKEQLVEQEALLVSLGIIDEKKGFLRFNGDEFERIYLKYIAKQKQVTFSSWRVPSEAMFWIRFEQYLSHRWQNIQILGRISLISNYDGANAAGGDITKKEIDEAFFETPFAEELITTMLSPDGVREYLVIHGTMEVDHERSNCSLLWSIEKEAKVDKLISQIEEMASRAHELGWSLKFDNQRMTKPEPLNIARMIKSKASSIFNARMAATIGSYLPTAYIDSRDRELAQEYVDCILELAERPRPSDLNNIGYVALTRADYESAERFFSQTLLSNEDIDRKLALYNLGICCALSGKIDDAVNYLKRAEAEAADNGAGCILSLEEQAGQLTANEVFTVNAMQSHIQGALEICGRLARPTN